MYERQSKHEKKAHCTGEDVFVLGADYAELM